MTIYTNQRYFVCAQARLVGEYPPVPTQAMTLADADVEARRRVAETGMPHIVVEAILLYSFEGVRHDWSLSVQREPMVDRQADPADEQPASLGHD